MPHVVSPPSYNPSPQARTYRQADPKIRGKMVLEVFFFDVLPFQVALKILHRTNIETNTKSKI